MIYRELKPDEYDLLKGFLYEAIYIPEGAAQPDRDIVKQPELALYYEDFGTGKADQCIVAEDAGKVICAARMYKKVGFRVIDENAEEYIMICDLQELPD